MASDDSGPAAPKKRGRLRKKPLELDALDTALEQPRKRQKASRASSEVAGAGRRRAGPVTYAEDAATDGTASGDGSTSQSEDEELEPGDLNDECCTACGSSEDYDSLLCCEICPCVYHLHCLDPPLLAVPKGDWFCPRCTRLLELENLERILAMRTRSAEAIAAEAAAATGKGAAKSATSSKAAATKDSNSNSVAAAIRASIATIRSVVNSPTHGQTAPPDAPETSAREGADGSTPASPAAAKPAGAMGPAAIGTPSKSASAADALPPALLPGDKPGQVVREFHVKWKGRSYMHCSWVRESDLELLGRRLPGVRAKWVNFLRKDNQAGQANDHADESDVGDWVWGVHRNWLLVDRVVASREKRGSGMQYLVKWKDLGYDECTWEDEADLRAFRAEIDRFKSRQEPIATQLADRRASHAQAGPSTTSGPPPRRSARGKKEGERRFSGTPDFLTGGSLHPYQLEGLNWLFFAWEQRKHVILADEMGLGKTIQAIAFMAALKQEHVPRPHLVVVPLSTLPNWEREFATWAPQLNVVTFAGNQAARDTIKQYEFLVSAQAPPGKGKGSRAADHQARIKFHVLLTSYEMALAEISELRRLHWETLIVDEGHRLKNSSSRLFTALHDLRAVQRTLLTGTPLQNNLGELFMLLHFLDASKFGSQEEFQQEFADISHGEQVTRLHQLLSPHLLRRTKKDVLKQLPPKREQIVRVELSALQKEYYRGILTKNFPNLAAGRAQTSRLKNVMMELRKCCNHPYLFEGAEPHIADPQKALAELVEASGKLALLDKMMAKMKECGHRVLIYSQFTRLLDILEDWLVGRRWGYQRIDGTIASADRQARIDAFNTHPADNFCFLLSTRAGGLGINLATADTVIIYDSDWNPHNDLQAQARAHRLGQQRGVMIYRLVTRATIEERMMQQTKKKMVLEHLVVQKMGAASDLRQDELDDLLRYGAAELFADAASRQLLVATHPSAGDADKASLEGGAAATAVATQGAGGDAGKPNAVIRTAEREQQEGRTGGDARRIVYDDAAIERLLDRSDLLHQPPDQEEEKEGDLMKAFKVANFEFMEDEADQNGTGKDGEAEDAGVPPPDTSKTSASFWGELLKDKFAELEEAETSALGKGKRERKQVNYQDPSLPVAAGAADEATSDKEDTSFSASHTASASSEEGSGSDSEASAGGRRGRKRLRRDSSLAAAGGAAPALPPLLRSHGSQLHILGFTSAHRDLFIKTLMRFGLGPARPDGGFTWDRYKPLFPRMPAGQVEAYGRLLLQHLNTPEPQDGVPKAALLQGNKSEDVLIRLATLHLILHKLQETEGKDPATFTAGPAGWRRLAATRVWAPEQDRKLLQGVRRRGYGRWRDILTDPELGLEPVRKMHLWIKQRLLAVVEALRAEYCSNGTPADGVATIESAKAGHWPRCQAKWSGRAVVMMLQSDAVNAAKLVADYQRMLVLTRKVREEALAIASNPQATVGMVINAGNMFRADLLKLEELARAMMHSASFLYKPPPMPDAVQAAQPTAGPSAPGRVPSGISQTRMEARQMPQGRGAESSER
ncbi:hypothetical protein WJX72_001585 [[Myrmecia] bisecta]|uniref:Uncharacterized protein n=1 Tax=[Myrmecia] bisecta TaxID=41462 RepID=A0AAW1R5D2_9CHLO